MTEGGRICVQSINFEWRIERFFHLPQQVNYSLHSPHFTFCGARWKLQFYPHGTCARPDWASMYLTKEPSSSSLQVIYTFGIKRTNGSILKTFSGTMKLEKALMVTGAVQFIQTSEFITLENDLHQDNTLRVFCTLSVDGCEPFQQTPLSENIEELKQKLSAANEEKEVAIETSRRQDLTLSENFKELFQTRYEADTTVRVGAKEILVHKLVLAARSSVFRVMFETDMVEKNDGVINIEDCEPGPFEDFLLFLYGGQFDIVKPSNALQLCLIADKYNVVQLKEKCFEIMSKEMSPESVCDAVYLATLYNEEELLRTATKYFVENMDTVVCSPKWFSFLSEHTAAANELLVKVAKNIKH